MNVFEKNASSILLVKDLQLVSIFIISTHTDYEISKILKHDFISQLPMCFTNRTILFFPLKIENSNQFVCLINSIFLKKGSQLSNRHNPTKPIFHISSQLHCTHIPDCWGLCCSTNWWKAGTVFRCQFVVSHYFLDAIIC